MAATLGEEHTSQAEGGVMSLDARRLSSEDHDGSVSTITDAVHDDEASNDNCADQHFAIAKSEFNKNRKIWVKNIPAEAKYEDITDFFTGYPTKNVAYEENSQQAEVVLENGDDTETAVSELDGTSLLGDAVSVCAGTSPGLVCVAHLPQDYTTEQLGQLVSEHGTASRVFLMLSEKTGKSKGYGFVEYDGSPEQTRHIVERLDGYEVEGHKIHVELVEERLQTWDKLQSRCLLINNLPLNYVDITKLRETFSVDTSPVYCQIAVKEGKSLGYGIIEFKGWEEAETAWTKLQGHEINDTPISLSFCIPGRLAVFIYNRIMWKMDKKLEPSCKSSLLPDPLFVSPALLNSPLVKGLTTQFPILISTFMKSLQALHQTYINSVLSRNTKPGLLGPAPFPPISPIMNPNMQLGLLIFISLQMQAQQPQQFTGPLSKQLNMLGQTEVLREITPDAKPSLLGDPLTARANMLTQNLTQQLNSMSTPSTGTPAPPSSSSPTQPQGDADTATPKPLMSTPTDVDPKSGEFYQQNLQNVRNLNLNLLMSLGQVMLSMQNKQQELDDKESKQHQQNTPRNGPASLMGSSMADQTPQSFSTTNSTSYNTTQDMGGQQGGASGYGVGDSGGGKASLLGEPPVSNTAYNYNYNNSGGGGGGGGGDTGYYDNQGYSQQSYGGDRTGWGGPAYDDSGCWDVPENYQQAYTEQQYTSDKYSGQVSTTNTTNESYSTYNNNNNSAYNTSTYNTSTYNNSTYNNSNYSNSNYGNTYSSVYSSYNNYQDTSSSNPSSMSYTGGSGLLPTPGGTSTTHSGTTEQKAILSTPVGQKRSYSSLLPAPEPSPEGGIVGQHSQGIGGHYADSYAKRIKLDQRY